MSAQLLLFAIDVIGFFSILLFGLRVLVKRPKQLNAQLIALICFNTACAIVLARQDYAFWIPEAYQLHVGVLRVPLHIARNLTSGLLMILCHSLFQDESKLPRWLAAAFGLQVLMEFVGAFRSTNGSEWQYNLLQTVPALLQLLFAEQRVYRDGELTIASLAQKLAMPEYQLCKLIHEKLGYRNFNALLHEYRIAEACRDLADPTKNSLPILTIA